MNTRLLILGCCSALLAGSALAQTDPGQTTVEHTVVVKDKGGTASGAVAGAVAGALVAGPVGAVVGGVAGATVGHSVAPPTEVRTYVTTQRVDTTTAYGRPIVVGHTVDGDVVWREIPDYPKYHWAYLDGHRVVVETRTNKVVEVD